MSHVKEHHDSQRGCAFLMLYVHIPSAVPPCVLCAAWNKIVASLFSICLFPPAPPSIRLYVSKCSLYPLFLTAALHTTVSVSSHHSEGRTSCICWNPNDIYNMNILGERRWIFAFVKFGIFHSTLIMIINMLFLFLCNIQCCTFLNTSSRPVKWFKCETWEAWHHAIRMINIILLWNEWLDVMAYSNFYS